MAQNASGSDSRAMGDRMEIEEEARKKRDREIKFHDPREENEQDEDTGRDFQEPGETAPNPPPKKLDLDDIMATLQKSVAQNEAGFSKLDKEMIATKHEAREGKELAAKATTLATETKNKLEALERRVEQLEKNPGVASVGGKTGAPQRAHPNRPQNPNKRDRDYLGGDEGNTIVVGGFRNHADRDERRGEWDTIFPKLPEELTEQIVETIVPPARSIIFIKTAKQTTTKKTRDKMITWTQKFKALKMETQLEGEDRPRVLYATPSKPFSMRQRDAKFSQAFEGLKLAAGDLKEHLNAEISRGKILFDRIPLIERDPVTEEPIYHMTKISEKIPGLTRETLDEKIAEAKRLREAERNT